MIAALFGDVHGNLPGLYDMCSAWQDENNERIDLVLQTGDMGLFRSFDEMDKAARKHLEKDQTEPAAAEYVSGKRAAPVDTWFVHGNHENFPLLRLSENRPVDPAGRIVFLGPGTVREFRKGGEALRIAALGGMEYRFGKFPIPSDERVQKYLHPQLLDRLLATPGKVDVLLLHDAPLNKGLRNKFPTGSTRLTEFIRSLQPRFAFYGHYDDPPEPFRIGSTLCAGLNSARAKRIPGRDGAMGILRTDRWEFCFVES